MRLCSFRRVTLLVVSICITIFIVLSNEDENNPDEFSNIVEKSSDPTEKSKVEIEFDLKNDNQVEDDEDKMYEPVTIEPDDIQDPSNIDEDEAENRFAEEEKRKYEEEQTTDWTESIEGGVTLPHRWKEAGYGSSQEEINRLVSFLDKPQFTCNEVL